jgi:hypothetical protein
MARVVISRRFKPVVLGGLTAIGLMVIGHSLLSASTPSGEVLTITETTPAGTKRPELQGVASCAAAACHHGNGPKGAWRSEYTTWINYDPHANAYETLHSDKSSQIMDHLHEKTPAPKNERCLNCHVQAGIHSAAPSDQFIYEDGVGCESCHGAAENWKAEHFRWTGLAAPDKAKMQKQFGMVRTEDVVVRARTCVVCHVGSPGVEVDHDLIAAGHPRLSFEFGAYHANMPHHWRDAKDKANSPDFEARAWMIGQVVSAKAALKLLVARADPKNQKPWPEFAEYECFGCHHDLRSPSWRQGPSPHREPGQWDWGTWYFAMLPRALSIVSGDRGSEVSKAFDELKTEMQKRPPNRVQVVSLASRLNQELSGLEAAVVGCRFKDKQLADYLSMVRERDKDLESDNWDGAVQRYLALAALHNARSDLGQPDAPAKAALRALVERLSFSSGYNSPHDFRPMPSAPAAGALKR